MSKHNDVESSGCLDTPCMVYGFGCIYWAFDCNTSGLVCKGKSEELCIVREACLDFNEPSLGWGLVTDETNREFCKVAAPCCAVGLKFPEYCCRIGGWFLCIKTVGSLPFDKDYVGKPICAVGGVQCFPEFSCCGRSGTESACLERPMNVYLISPSRKAMSRVDDSPEAGEKAGIANYNDLE
ncbi:unnamed protein product [Cylindrotheca closterium]|uniref:Uncharacterized protein n=1 Tax=Cylindrotheca closterium TaxID=2856 RepID=A0AAD2CUC2_9STRA|nr:unnamed protein product [Cylindrotheca closterium]